MMIGILRGNSVEVKIFKKERDAKVSEGELTKDHSFDYP